MYQFFFLQILLLVTVPSLGFDFSKVKDLKKCFVDPDYEKLVDIAQKGLGQKCNSKKVVIVGAGISGLTAAKLLKDAGCQVSILEASDRVGGRIVTHRQAGEDWYVELGPMRLPKTHRIVRTFIEKLKLHLNPFAQSHENGWYFINGIRARAKDVIRNPGILNYTVNESEKGKSAAQLYSEAMYKAVEKLYKWSCNEIWEKYDTFSTKEYLIKEGGLSRGAVQMIGDLMNRDSSFHISFLSSVTDYVAFLQVGFDEITGGFSNLPRAFHKSLPGVVRFNSPVVKIVRNGDGATVYYRTVNTKGVSSVTADYVLVTATARAARLIQFQPTLSYNKTDALRSIHYAAATKIALICTEKFWEKDGIPGGQSITDQPARFIYYPDHKFPSGLGVILASYTVNDDAEFFTSLSNERCLDVVLDDLAAVHNISKAYLQRVCKKHVVKKWNMDEYAMGAFAAFTPYQFIDFYKVLFENEGRIHFAGEHTGFPHAWIDTAMLSALKASLNIYKGVH
ncbi:L-amino-acid oxidase-like [Alligator sinensis]|uniref:Amine oxidase n=1 Tax=Alligator sinensis TaxID=38654 RepID=A0A1U7SCD6_ALLSI|nr:L-amino-acid oxidase-like [Alligator sinensis]